MAKDILVTAEKIKKRKSFRKTVLLIFCLLFVVLTVTFIILAVVFSGGKFTISLYNEDELVPSLALFDTSDYNEETRKLYADEIDDMDNISINWIPSDVDGDDKEGSHNGQNYIAYTFYVGNVGDKTVHYWYEVVIDEVIKNVDEAVRIMIFRNGERTVYAKVNSDTGEPELNTVPFKDEKLTKDRVAIIEKVENFEPDARDRFTIVVWLEGDDPDCVNAIIGGGIKMHMNIREERIGPNNIIINEEKEEQNEEENE